MKKPIVALALVLVAALILPLLFVAVQAWLARLHAPTLQELHPTMDLPAARAVVLYGYGIAGSAVSALVALPLGGLGPRRAAPAGFAAGALAVLQLALMQPEWTGVNSAERISLILFGALYAQLGSRFFSGRAS